MADVQYYLRPMFKEYMKLSMADVFVYKKKGPKPKCITWT